jgi:YesN/AraC family two-component response regulator
LVVDDDPGILDLHARIVQGNLPGCHILKAHNGREALAIMELERPDLVLLDLMMPEVDGFAVLEAKNASEIMRSVPVIVLTAQILTESDMARLQQGVAAVLGKGLFSVEEVLVQVETILARSKRLSSAAQRVARQVMSYIHEHYAESISVDAIARHFGLSERHLTRCFHQETGVSVLTYLSRYRMIQAKLLLKTGASVTEVALAVGFSDSSYFGRVFRREVGITPTTYQRKER